MRYHDPVPDESDKPATKADITRLDQKIDRVAVEVVKTHGQMRQMEERIDAKTLESAHP